MENYKTEKLDETAASDTLAPNSRPADDMSKTDMMASMMSYMNGMSRGDMIDFFNKSMTQFGPNADLGVPDVTAERNLQSVTTVGAVKEDVDTMFAGQDLTEDFKEKVTTLIESAVNAQVALYLTQLQEEQEQQFEQLVEEYKEELTGQVDDYLNYAVNEWVNENKLQIENAMKLDLHDSFMNGLANLFKEHYIDIPDEKFDVLQALQDEIDSLKEHVNDVENKCINLASTNEELSCQMIFSEMRKGLTENDAVKFESLIENLTYTDLDNYKSKLQTIKESYFATKPVSTSGITQMDDVIGISSLNEETDKEIVNSDPEITELAKLMSKTARR
jgi:hypothetical protein